MQKANSIVLMYHDIGRESGFQNKTAMKYKVSAEVFETHLIAIKRWMDDNRTELDRVVFTFDDGGESFITNAAPILEKYGFRGVFFISTGYIGNRGFLDAEQIRELAERGHRIGSHSHSHPERMSALSSKEIQDEWSISQMMLNEVLGYKPAIASIPNGYSSPEVLKSMVSSDISEIYTSHPTSKVKKEQNYILIGRYAITVDMSTDEVLSIVKSPYKRFKINCRQQILDFAKSVLGNYYLAIREKLIK